MNNKEIVGNFLGAFAKQDAETMRKFADADYIQHNPFVPTGLEPFIGVSRRKVKKKGLRIKSINITN